MDELVRSQMLIDDLANAIAEEDDEQALKYYGEYKKIYEKITGKNLTITFEELKNLRKKKTTEQEIENEL